jgi:hypothetical protein
MMRTAVLAGLLGVAVCAEDPLARRTSFDEGNASLCVVPAPYAQRLSKTAAPRRQLSAPSERTVWRVAPPAERTV